MSELVKSGFHKNFGGLKTKSYSMAIGVLLLFVTACGVKDDNKNNSTDAAANSISGSSGLEKQTEATKNSDASVSPKNTQGRIVLEPSQDIATDNPAIADLPKARITTSMGPITIVLYPEQAPISVENFKNYVAGRHYSRTVFHRVIPGFMIQGGGYSSFLEPRKTNDPIRYEGDNGLNNDRGTIAMARTSNPDSATSQWYINHEDNENLNHGARGPDVPGYTVFGRVISGMNIVDAIALVETGTQVIGNGQTLQNVPVDPVVINNVEMLN